MKVKKVYKEIRGDKKERTHHNNRKQEPEEVKINIPTKKGTSQKLFLPNKKEMRGNSPLEQRNCKRKISKKKRKTHKTKKFKKMKVEKV